VRTVAKREGSRALTKRLWRRKGHGAAV